MARDLVPKGRFGIALYDQLGLTRRDDRTRWNADDLAAALHERKVEISAKQIRAWLKGQGYPRTDVFMAICEVLGVQSEQLWPSRPLIEDGLSDAQSGADQALQEEKGKQFFPHGKKESARKQSPARRRSGSK